MIQHIKHLVLLIMILITPVIAQDAQTQLELFYTQKAQQTADSILGSGKAVVAVQVRLSNQKTIIDFSQSKKQSEKGGAKSELLPGFSGIKSLQSGAFPNSGFFSAQPVKIKAIKVHIIADKRAGKRDIKIVSESIGKLLKLDAKRGDKISTEFLNFPKPMSPGEVDAANSASGGSSGALWFLVIVVMAFIGAYVYFQLQAVKLAKAAGSSSGGGGGGGGGGGSSAPKKEAVSAGGGQVAGAMTQDQRYFSFVNLSNLSTIKVILDKEKWSSEDVAIMLSKLSNQLASRFLKMSEPEEKTKLMAAFVKQESVSFKKLEDLDKKLQTLYECMVGGDTVVKPILQSVEQLEKEKLFVILKDHKDIYDALRPLVFLFEDILHIEEADLKRIVGKLAFDDLGKIMTDLHDHFQDSETGEEKQIFDKMMSCIPESSKELIEQQVTMKSGKYDEEDIQIAIKHFFDLLREARAAGRVHFDNEEEHAV